MNPPLEITLLGTGTSQGIPVIGCSCKVCSSPDPRDKRLRTAAFIKVDGVGLAVDLGPDFRTQMLNNNLSNVHAVLLTHEHSDHISGLDDIRPINYKYQREIPIYGLSRSIHEIRRRFDYAFNPEYQYPGKPLVTSIIIDEEPFSVKNIQITPIQVDHGDMPILGFRIGNLAYITDAKFLPGKSKLLLENLDILILNALRIEPHKTHLNIKEALEIINELKPKQCYLIHISHDIGLHNEINAILPQGISLGYDGLHLVLP